MALFDSMPSMDSPEGQGLLAAAFSLLQARRMPGERGIGGALGAAGQQYMGTRSQAMDQAQKRKLLDAQMAAQQSEVDQRQAKIKADQAKMAEEARIRGLLAGAGSVRPGLGAGLPDGTLPPEFSTGQTFPAMQIPGQIDYQSLFKQGVPLEMLKGLAETPNLGMPEVARTMKGMVGGREVDQQFDKFGRPVGAGMEQYKAPIMLDRGGQTDALSPYLQPGASFPKTMTFADKTAQGQLGVSQANLGLARQRLAFDQAQGGNKAPAGYRFTADGRSLEAIPGGPADIKAGELGAKTEAKRTAQISQANDVLETVREAKKMVGFNTAGVGGYAAKLPATEARDLSGKLETIKANLGFDRLQQMRDQSPTGGALGAVAVQELTSLQSTIASLDQMQTPGQVKTALDKIDRHYTRWLDVMNQAGGGKGGATAGWEAPKKADWVYKNGKLVKAD